MRHYHYTECGLNYVYLVNGYKTHNTDYGEGISFDDKIDESIARFIVKNKPYMEGQDLRFLRSLMHVSQKNMGKFLGVTRDNIAKIEALPDKHLTGTLDKLLRVQYTRHADDAGIRAMMDYIEDMEEKHDLEKLVLKRKRSGEWEIKEAC